MTLWKPLRHYGVPEKIVNIILNSDDGLHREFVHGAHLTDASQVRTNDRKGCLLSTFLFLVVDDWIMKTMSQDKHSEQTLRRGATNLLYIIQNYRISS